MKIIDIDNKSLPSDYQISPRLNDVVNETMKNIKKKKSNKFIIAAGVIISFFAINILLTFISPAYRTFADSIPVLDSIVDWIRNDRGMSTAILHEYPDLGPILVEGDNYSIKLKNIYLDDARMAFDITVTSNVLNNILDDTGTTEKIDANNQVNVEFTKDLEIFPKIEINKFYDFGVVYKINTNDHISTHVEFVFNQIDMIGDIIEKNDELEMHIKLIKGNELIMDLGIVKIPLDKDKIFLSKILDINKDISLENSILNISKLQISPTKTLLNYEAINGSNYMFESLYEAYLKTSNNMIYFDTSTLQFFRTAQGFDESIFYSEKLDLISLGYEGVYYSLIDEPVYEYKIGEKLPIEFEYDGVIFKLVYFNISENKTLKTIIEVNEEYKFMTEGLVPVTGKKYESTESQYEGIIEISCSYSDVELSDSYKLKLSYPRVLHLESNEIVLVDGN